MLTSNGFVNIIEAAAIPVISMVFNFGVKHLAKDENNNGIPDIAEKLPSFWQKVSAKLLAGVKKNVCSYAEDKGLIKDDTDKALLEAAVEKALLGAPKVETEI